MYLYHLKSVCYQWTEWTLKKKKFHGLRNTNSVLNVTSPVLICIFSIISNYEDGQNRAIQSLKPTRISNLIKKYMFKINKRNTREICQKITIKTPERHHWCRLGIFIVNYISPFLIVFLMMTLNMYLFPGRDIIKSLRFDSQYGGFYSQ